MLARKWWTPIPVRTAIFMLLLDLESVNVALPDTHRELHSSCTDPPWVADACAPTLAARAERRVARRLLGRRRVLVASVVTFTAAPALRRSGARPTRRSS